MKFIVYCWVVIFMSAKIKYKRIVFLMSVFLLFLIAFSGSIPFMPDNQDSDSSRVLDMSEDIGDNGDNSFGVAAAIFSLIPAFLLNPVIFVVGIFSIYLFTDSLKSKVQCVIGFIVLIPPLYLILGRPVKDFYIIILSIFVFYVIKSKIMVSYKILIILLIYFSYSILFYRQYYLLIGVFFLFSYVYSISGLKIRFIMLVSIVPTLMLVPNHLFFELQGVRDLINTYRIEMQEVGSRTAFLNPLRPDNALSFLINYFYAAFRTIFPIFFTSGVREVFMSVVYGVYFFLIFKGLKSSNKSVNLSVYLVFSHMAVLWIFTPDIGTNLRHFTSVFIYFIPVFMLLNDEELH